MPRLLFLFALFSLTPAAYAQAPTPSAFSDLTQIPFEHLLDTKLERASTIARQVSDAPSAVSIVTASDIRAHGYRTLAEVIDSMRGLYTTYDRKYDYLGGRAYGKPGDFAGRIMLLIDGYASQDNIFNQAFIGNSGLLDLELVERVEYVPGTGSVTYGNNALLGIINIVTKNGRDINGAQVSTEIASFGTQKQRLTYGKQLDNGADILLSASSLKSKGQDLFYPEYNTPAYNNGVANNLDGEKADRLFGKFKLNGLTIEAGYSRRNKDVSSVLTSYTDFNRPYQSADENAFFNALYEDDISLNLKSATRFYQGYYANQDFYQFSKAEIDGDPTEHYRKNNHQGQWRGIDQKLIGTWFKNHTIILGAEFRDDFQQNHIRRYLSESQNLVRTSAFREQRQISSLYAEDAYSVSPAWSFVLGIRYDDATDGFKHTSPRIAVIHAPSSKTEIKLSYSEAFRLPNPEDKRAYGTLAQSEFVAAQELLIKHSITPYTQWLGALYHYTLSNLIYDTTSNGNYANTGKSHSDGIETEIQSQYPNGLRTRASLALQHAVGTDQQHLINSPDVLAKTALSFPVLQKILRTGLEVQYLGRRITPDTRQELGGVTLAHLTLSSERSWHGVSTVFSIRNLFNRQYEVVAWLPKDSNNHFRETLQMDGRSYWLQLTYNF